MKMDISEYLQRDAEALRNKAEESVQELVQFLREHQIALQYCLKDVSQKAEPKAEDFDFEKTAEILTKGVLRAMRYETEEFLGIENKSLYHDNQCLRNAYVSETIPFEHYLQKPFSEFGNQETCFLDMLVAKQELFQAIKETYPKRKQDEIAMELGTSFTKHFAEEKDEFETNTEMELQDGINFLFEVTAYAIKDTIEEFLNDRNLEQSVEITPKGNIIVHDENGKEALEELKQSERNR